MQKLRIGVVRGGPSDEYDVSLKTGEIVMKSLKDKYIVRDIFIDKSGQWYMDGVCVSVADVADRVDCVFNALHGKYGEDGGIQKDLEMFGVPYTGSGVFSSAIAMNKILTKEKLSDIGIKTPRHVTIKKREDVNARALEIFRTLPQPSIVKPVCGGSSIATHLAGSFNELINAINEALEMSDVVLVEEYIKGREASCGVINEFRGEGKYALPPVEIIIDKENKFFDHDAKYSGNTQEVCPANFNSDEKNEIMNMAKLAHEELGLRHYSRSDFIVSPRGIYMLEVNTLPGLTEESLFPKSIYAVGGTLENFLDHILTLAINSR